MYGSTTTNTKLQGGIVAGYYAGSAVGSAAASYCMDRISRRWSLLFGSVVSVVGAVLQACAVSPAMMIVGRAFSGFSTGMVYPVAPVYLSEISPPENRAFLVGLKGVWNTFGFFLAGWIGYAGAFASGDIQWRIPLATQAPPAAVLAVLTFFLPYSPRWLIMRERYEEAESTMRYLHAHRSQDFISQEFNEMQAQVQLEAQHKTKSNLLRLFSKQYIRRTLLGTWIVQMCKLSGSNIIQNYQNVMYANLGYEGNTALLITAIYGFMALVGQIFSIFTVADHWPRRRTVITGWLTLAGCLIVLTVLSALYGEDGNPNKAGQRAGIAFIFLFALSYSVFFNSAVWVIVAEIFPLELRAVGVGWSTFSQYLTAIWLSYGASYAFEVITWKF
ncbi:High-affinity glucose transporter [Pseudocercospora fuligena]|uniref:High-affinity glucose transporter n=1 Tax=Pseudocercospora fuligena TaxID=685502 RepID=A0A8H6RW78_9PEZI|nr:High-affinity glucose transporter [Pseudocercospora fuligena]